MDTKRVPPLQIRLSAEELDALRTIAERERRSVAGLARIYVQDGIARQTSSKPAKK